MTRLRKTTLTSCAVALAAAACGDAHAPPPVEPGVSLALARHRAESMSDLRYAFRLEVPGLRDEPVQGRLRATFRWHDASHGPLVLDFLEPERRVHAVRVGGRPVPFEARDEHVVVAAGELEPFAENVVEVDFTAGDASLNRQDDFLYALFVPERARYSLPVFDQPDLKGRFTLELTVPEGWTAVANGPRDGEAEPSGRGVTFRFLETRPLPTYLFSFAAGRFEVESAERDGRTLRMFHRETDAERVSRNRDAIFDLHAAALAWLEDYTAIPYPFQKFDFVAVPSFQYGGMEHPGAVFYRASSLFLEESATQAQLLGRAGVIAHETAHMWFGDLVTMRWFDDVWTKEVFAGFMAAKIVNPSFPALNHELRFFLSHHPTAYDVDRTDGANPIRQPLDNLADAGSLYGAVIYQKAPVVMDLLERLVGEETFRDGLRRYLDRYAYANAAWPDLIAILDELSPRDVAGWSRVWVEEAGRPEVWVDRAEGGAWTARQADPAGLDRVWPQPLSVLAAYRGRTEALPVELDAAAVPVRGAGAGEPPDFVLPDGRGIAYGRQRLDPESRAHLLEHLPELDDALVRGVAWVSLWDAVLEGEVDPDRFLKLLVRGVREETDELNLQRVLGLLEVTYWRFLTPAERGEKAPGVEAALQAGLAAAKTSTVRAAFMWTLADVAVTEPTVARLRRVWALEEEVPGLPVSESDLTTLAMELAVREVPDSEEILEAQRARISDPDRLARFDFVAPALSRDPAVREAFFASLVDETNRERERWVLLALRYLHHPLRASHARRFLLPGLELVEEIQRTGDIFFPKRWLDATLGGHASPEAAATVTEFLAARPDYPPRLRQKIVQSADLLMRASRVHGAGAAAAGGGQGR